MVSYNVRTRSLKPYSWVRISYEAQVRIFVFNFCLLSFLNYPRFWEMVVDNVFVFLCKNI